MSSKPPIVSLGSPPASENDFQIYSSRPAVRFLSRGVQPPSQVYIEVQDVLQVNCASSAVSEVVTVSYRVLRPDGELIKGQFQLFPPATRFQVTKQEPLPEGFLLSLSCKATQANRRGITFVRMFLTDPVLGSGQPSYMLMSDYATNQAASGYPGGRVLAPTEGPGVVYPVLLSNPGFGNEFSVTIPTNALWRIQTVFAELSTSAAVANRFPRLLITNGVNLVLDSPTPNPQAAGVLRDHTWAAGCPATFNNGSAEVLPLPVNFTMGIGEQIRSLTDNLQGGDQWLSIAIWVEEWLENV